MLKKIVIAVVMVASLSLLASPVKANGLPIFIDTFTLSSYTYSTWNYVNFEAENPSNEFGRGPVIGKRCGTDACARVVTQGLNRFLRISIADATTAGVYTNTDVAEVEVGSTNGHWTPQVGKPIVVKAKARWNSAYHIDGSGAATGSSGIVLWDASQVDIQTGNSPSYKHFGITWSDQDTAGGYIAGLTANVVIDLNPFTAPILRPSPTLNINNWMELKMVWSVNALGQQSVEYFINSQSLGVTPLVEPLSNLSLELWNDNQVPQFTPEGFMVTYPSPEANQYFDLDYVTVYQQLF